jgi:eukaryotic-like serine/threonine-protein kinase
VATAPTVPTPKEAVASNELGRGTQFGRYLILDVLGEGGMGKVFAAHDAQLDRNIALKIVRHASTQSETWLVREARAMARIQHPAIVAVHDIGSVGGRVFIAMELVHGTTLRRWLDAEPRTWRAIVEIYVAAGRGVEAAHAAGVVHRDFKPENVLVDLAGRARVSDFGIADLRDEAGMAPNAGTSWYLAPEQFASRGADERSDQFSFCVALWQAVYGEHPFTEVEAELATAVAAGTPKPPPDRGPRWLEAALRRGLAVDPAQRFASMTALLAALDRGLASRRWRAIGTLGIAVAAAGIATTIVLLAHHDAGPSCAGAGATEVWSPARHGQVLAALHGLEPAVAAGVVGELDRYVQSWSDQRVEACRATNERGEQSGELLDLRMACLDRRIAELDALATEFATGDRAVAASAPTAIEALVPLSACTDTASLRDVVPLPQSPSLRARVAAVRAALGHERADYATGRFARGLAAIQPLVHEADAIGYAPLVAELELDHGMLAWHADKMDEGEAALYRAVAAAEAGRDGATAAHAWVQLLWFVSQERRKPDEAWRLATIARGAVERYAGDPALRTYLADELGSIALDLGKLDDAQRELQLAYDDRVKLGDQQSIAASLQHLGMLATERGDHTAALADHARALAMMERTLGADHPDTLAELETFAAAYYEAGQLDKALAMYRDGLTRVEASIGDAGIDAAGYMHNIALVVMRQAGDHVEAIAMQRRAVAIFTDVRGALAVDTVEQRANLANMLRVAKRYPDAIDEYHAVLPQIERAYGRNSELAAVALEGLGRALIDSGHKREAIEPLTHAVEVREHLGNGDLTAKARDELGEATR